MAVRAFQWRSGAQDDIRMGIGHGALNLLHYAEDRAKANAVVRGGHRSFLTGSHLGGPLGIRDVPGTRRARATVGGFLRRSIHAYVSVDGRVLSGRSDDNGEAIPSYGNGQIIGALGTNCGYGGWVDQGTSRMPARPMIMPAFNDALALAEPLLRAGAEGYWRGRP
jgi:hypothetical protein